MVFRHTANLVFSLLLGVLLLVLGTPEAPAADHDAQHQAAHELERPAEPHDHRQPPDLKAKAEGTAAPQPPGHCHPGLDCSVAAVYALHVYHDHSPVIGRTCRHVPNVRMAGFVLTDDPPPPRRSV